MTTLHPTLQSVTDRIIDRSRDSRSAYLEQVKRSEQNQPRRTRLSCTNFAHAVAAASSADKLILHQERSPNVGIVSAYNDMLSAHQPFDRFPEIIREAVRSKGASAQFAGGVPAMCDGVTQGRAGMELSLFSRDVIAQATAIALSHDVFDAVIYLGTCDKIVPGLVMGALGYGHLPAIFAPAGPMQSGIANSEKAIARQKFAQGKITRSELMESECASYHGPGTCTFYGTANSNQMLMEIMGLHLPGSAFINPGDDLRDRITVATTHRAVDICSTAKEYTPIAQIVDEKSVCNGIVGLLATGGSTNHTIHLVAMARCAGIVIDWSDFNDLSAIIPTITRVYPNGKSDVNQFHAAGGMSLVIKQLLDAGLLHNDVTTVIGKGLERYCTEPVLKNEALTWQACAERSADDAIISTVSKPFAASGGLALLTGNLGRSMIKLSAVAPEHHLIKAPARLFYSQAEFLDAFDKQLLNEDFVAIVLNQGPTSNGMPELHKLTPALGVLQDAGHRVALVTDGRMSGASGKVPAAIHVSPECAHDGPLGKVREGDMICLDAGNGTLDALVDITEWNQRSTLAPTESATSEGRLLFANMRRFVSSAETGALTLFQPDSL